MKFGVRNPSISKRIAARTTSKYERNFKRITNPYYGKKGSGYIKDPDRALYNHLYNKTTIGIDDLFYDKKYKILSQKKFKDEDDYEYTAYEVSTDKQVSFHLVGDKFLKHAKKNDDYTNLKGIYNTKIYEYKFPKFRKIDLEIAKDEINILIRNTYIATLNSKKSYELLPYLKENNLKAKRLEIYGGKWKKANLFSEETDKNDVDELDNIVSYSCGEDKFSGELTFSIIDTFETESDNPKNKKIESALPDTDKNENHDKATNKPTDYYEGLKAGTLFWLMMAGAVFLAYLLFYQK